MDDLMDTTFLKENAMTRSLSCFIVLLAAGSTAVAGTEYPYTVTDLGLLPDAFSTVPLAINSDGVIVGWAQGPQSQTRGFIWDAKSGITLIPNPAGYAYSVARDISDTGVIVGHAKISILSDERAWRIQGGNFEWLGSLVANGFSEAWSCNDDGAVAGLSEGSGFSGNAFVLFDGLAMQDLTPGPGGSARAINDLGQVTGWVNNSPPIGTAQAFRWSQGTGRVDLGPLSSLYTITFGYAINDLGAIGGTAMPASGDFGIAFVHFPGTGYVPLPSQHTYDEVSGINNNGVAVGFSGNSFGTGSIAWMWSQGEGLTLLNTLVDPAAGFNILRPLAINDQGQIIALASRTLPPFEFGGGVVLTPVQSAVPGDVTGDGTVNIDDLLAVIAAWGPCPAPPAACVADVVVDGQVNIDDLLLVISNWG
jgi:probable HAF family extracellular repeat protein